MKLLVIAYPEISSTGFDLIQNCRKVNDKLYNAVAPHFTFIFPVPDFSINEFTNEIRKQTEGVNSISFCIRCAIISKDAFDEYYHIFLVPDEGNSRMIKLHDKLYSGKLSSHLRLDLEYIPHIGIGTSTDKLFCKKMADEWNEKEFMINGVISTLDIVKYENEKVTTIEQIKLNKL